MAPAGWLNLPFQSKLIERIIGHVGSISNGQTSSVNTMICLHVSIIDAKWCWFWEMNKIRNLKDMHDGLLNYYFIIEKACHHGLFLIITFSLHFNTFCGVIKYQCHLFGWQATFAGSLHSSDMGLVLIDALGRHDLMRIFKCTLYIYILLGV